MKAREIMTPDPFFVTPDQNLVQAAKIMAEHDVGIVPVVQDQKNHKLIGVVTDRDITVRHVAEGHEGGCLVREVMSDQLITANPDEDLDSIMKKMQDRQLRRIPVVENNELVGIIAQADVAVHCEQPDAVTKTVEGISEPAHPKR
jgi:CBS domain-containing protein